MLRNFLWIFEQLFKLSEITDSRQKLDWLLSYVEADMADQWANLPEYGAGSWTWFLERLRTEYPELTSKEQETMGQLHKLC